MPFDDTNSGIWYDDQGRPHISLATGTPTGTTDGTLPVDTSQLQDYANSLPAQAPDPGFTHGLPVAAPPGLDVYNALTGSGGQERYQLFPERIVRSALSLPEDVMSGKIATPVQQPASGSEEDYSSDPLLQRVQDMAALMGGGGMASTTEGMLGTAGSKLIQPATETAAPAAIAPTFYSAVENAVNTASMKSAPAQQWLSTIANSKGVKPEELDWTGLKDFLSEQYGPVSKQQVQDYLQQNKVGLGEVNKSDVGNDFDPGNYYKSAKNSNTKYSKYQLPGGENYREKLLTLPPQEINVKSYYNNTRSLDDPEWSQLNQNERMHWAQIAFEDNPSYKSSHWDEPNILAHIRMNDRTIDGKKALHIEEIQSDWHQQGREQGYKTTPEQKAELESIDQKLMNGLEEKDIGNPDMNAVLKTAVDKKVITAAEASKYKDYSKGENSTIPDAPFKKTWLDLALKRVIREAAEGGYDRVSWTPGEAQAARYDLSKQIKEVRYNKTTHDLEAKDHSGNVVMGERSSPEKLADYIGKEAADKLINSPTRVSPNKEIHTLSGLDLKVGGEGMHYFYDKMVPATLKKLTGEDMKVGNVNSNSKVMKAGPLDWRIVGEDGKGLRKDNGDPLTFQNEIKATNYMKENIKGKSVNYINLPQSVKDVALHRGFPLFSSGFMLNPVQSVPGMTPMRHNPFAQGDTSNDQINNKNDVPYLAGASNTPSGLPVNIDRRMPRYDPKVLDKTGKPADLYKYLSIHELEEHKAMLAGVPYAKAHSTIATPAERAAVEADGVNWNEYEKVMDGYLDEIEHEKSKNIPHNLYKKPYAHDKSILEK